MQTFEQIIDWQNRSFIDALFIDLKMLQFFKVIVPEGTIFTDAVTKELTELRFGTKWQTLKQNCNCERIRTAYVMISI